MEKVAAEGKVDDWLFTMIRLPEATIVRETPKVSCMECHSRYEKTDFVSPTTFFLSCQDTRGGSPILAAKPAPRDAARFALNASLENKMFPAHEVAPRRKSLPGSPRALRCCIVLVRWIRAIAARVSRGPVAAGDRSRSPDSGEAIPACLNCLYPQKGHHWICPHCGFPAGEYVTTHAVPADLSRRARCCAGV